MRSVTVRIGSSAGRVKLRSDKMFCLEGRCGLGRVTGFGEHPSLDSTALREHLAVVSMVPL